MNSRKTICLLNDSFPPLIDGVANAVMNYAGVIRNTDYDPVVITPSHPEEDDSAFPYPVIRYPSIDFRKMTGYMAGIPFSPDTAKQLSGRQIALLHTHCPVVSTFLGRELRQIFDAPLVLTYHTKFDIDIANILRSKALQEGSKRALVENINACDEVWAVSQGAADNLRSLGYEGECIVMPNGVDLPRQQASEAAVAEAVKGYDLPEGVPVYLFVGRMMWYKGLKLTLDALALLAQSGQDFRMVFIGSGADLEEVRAYSHQCGIGKLCIFTGPIRDREVLRAWYTRADLFLFPSTFDTNGLVVREAAACALGSVLISGSCAAEGVTDGQNALLIEQTPEAMFSCLHSLGSNIAKMRHIGENASRELYVSWQESVEHAVERYEIVMDRYQSGYYPSRRVPLEDVLRANGALMEDLARLQLNREAHREHLRSAMRNTLHQMHPSVFPGELVERLEEPLRELHQHIQDHFDP